MPKEQESKYGDEEWAQFRFSVVGPLLAAPPSKGELKGELTRLSAKLWKHPKSGGWVGFGYSTIERWYYQSLKEGSNPVEKLSRKIRADKGSYPSLSPELRAKLLEQYRAHKSWSYQLHHDNLEALVKQESGLGSSPSVSTVRRYMQAHGLEKRPRCRRRKTQGVEVAEKRFERYEIRSYESEYVNGLWHLDFHVGSVRVVLSDGQYCSAHLLGMLDDHSRLCPHLQWYFAENAENLIHGFIQGVEKRGLPRALMSDNGGAMIAAETVEGLARLGVVHERTLPYSAYQNGKQEVLWAQVEGRLLAMLEGCDSLSLAELNRATQAWVEMEYNRKTHRELKQSPLEAYLSSKDVGRPSPGSKALRQAFTAKISRVQRVSDGTVSVEGVRFEVPSRYRHLKRVSLRMRAWDLSSIDLADDQSGQVLCRLLPQDKHKNADGIRAPKAVLIDPTPACEAKSGAPPIAPLLQALINRYEATGLPPAYIPKDEVERSSEEGS